MSDISAPYQTAKLTMRQTMASNNWILHGHYESIDIYVCMRNQSIHRLLTKELRHIFLNASQQVSEARLLSFLVAIIYWWQSHSRRTVLILQELYTDATTKYKPSPMTGKHDRQPGQLNLSNIFSLPVSFKH